MALVIAPEILNVAISDLDSEIWRQRAALKAGLEQDQGEIAKRQIQKQLGKLQKAELGAMGIRRRISGYALSITMDQVLACVEEEQLYWAEAARSQVDPMKIEVFAKTVKDLEQLKSDLLEIAVIGLQQV